MRVYTLPMLRARCAIDPITDCWLHQGSLKNGYARMRHDGEYIFGHILAWELKNGSMPEGMDCGSTCTGPRRCINPDHHKPGTRTEIMRRVKARGRIARGVRKGVQYRGERSHFAKLDWPKVRDIRQRVFAGELQHAVAEIHGTTQNNVSKIANFVTWKEGFAA